VVPGTVVVVRKSSTLTTANADTLTCILLPFLFIYVRIQEEKYNVK